MGLISAEELKAQLLDRAEEMAVLDVREESQFGKAHLLAASSAPLGELEVAAQRLVPRQDTPTVLCSDTQDGLAERAQATLKALGYSDVRVLSGGLATCPGAGLDLFSGLNTPSKVLAAFGQRELGIAEISPQELATRIRSDETLQLLDCRPHAEYVKGTIPGAMNCPGGELPRLAAGLPDVSRTYVITCAGRSRGLTSAQLLKDQSFPGEVFALERGTMGWELSGQPLERGATRAAPVTSSQVTPSRTLDTALSIRRRHKIEALGPRELSTLRDDDSRTTVLFDIRSKAEFETQHIAGARHVTGGQLIHNIDMHIATRGARLVLCDDDGVRATSIALWLKRMGLHEIFLAPLDHAEHDTEMGPTPPEAPGLIGTAHMTDPSELEEMLRQNRAVVLDLANSRHYRKGHVAGAWFCKRLKLGEILPRFSDDQRVVLTSEDGTSAMYAAQAYSPDVGNLSALEGGTAAWRGAGHELTSGLERLLHQPDDVFLKPSELPGGDARTRAMEHYLEGTPDALDRAMKEGTLPLGALPVHDLDRDSFAHKETPS